MHLHLASKQNTSLTILFSVNFCFSLKKEEPNIFLIFIFLFKVKLNQTKLHLNIAMAKVPYKTIPHPNLKPNLFENYIYRKIGTFSKRYNDSLDLFYAVRQIL